MQQVFNEGLTCFKYYSRSWVLDQVYAFSSVYLTRLFVESQKAVKFGSAPDIEDMLSGC